MSYLNLNRRFVERETYDADELIATEVRGKRLEWSKVLDNHACVIVAPANFGKSTEMEAQASQMRGASDTAVFIALRTLAERKSLEKSLTPDNLRAYLAWKASELGTLTLFVDSLDEAAIGPQENIEYLVGDLAEAVAWPNERVRWVLSTRPAVLTPKVFTRLSEILAQPLTSVHTMQAIASEGAAIASTTAPAEDMTEKRLRLFSMAPLDAAQANTYLSGRYPSIASNEVLTLARERGLSGFTSSPGGLDILANIDLITNPPESLTEVFKRVVGAIQVLRAACSGLICPDTSIGGQSTIRGDLHDKAAP